MIRRFDVVSNPNPGRPLALFLVVLQSRFRPDLPTLVVAPLRVRAQSEGIEGLQTPVEFQGQDFAVMISELGHLPRRLLGRPAGEPLAYEYELVRALAPLFTGF